MKVLAYITGLTLFAISVSVSAIPSTDNIVQWGNVTPSSDAAEQQFIADYLGVASSDIWFYKQDGSAGADGGWTQIAGTEKWVYDFGSEGVRLFLFKGPDGNPLEYMGDTYTHFLYENSDRYAVIDLSVFGRSNKKGSIPVTIDVVSHIGAVPEPSIVALIGIGLLGLGFVHWRSNKRNLH